MRWRPVAVGIVVSLGCGPSFQAVYEGDARFEHCYALEETPTTSMQLKAECWRDWTQKSTYGQTRDRVEYAASRYRSLVKAPDIPTDEAMMQAAPGMVDTNNQLVAPTPTSAFAPPPVTNTPTPDPTPAPSAAPAPTSAPGPRAPNADCLDGCTTTWQACKDKAKCDPLYEKCAALCFTKK